jgi:hypothetical protein
MEILARKIGAHDSFPNVGYLEALFKIENNKIIKFTENEINRKIEVKQYSDINSKFLKGAIFKISINPDITDRENLKYHANGQDAERFEKIIELVKVSNLPSRNDKKITLETDNTPGTKVIFLVDDNSNCYGPLEWELFDSISNTILLKKISSEIEDYKLPEEFLNKIDLKDLLEFSFYDSDTSVVIINKISNLSIFLYNLKSYFDYSSDQEIIGFFTKKINTKNMPVSEITIQNLSNLINKNNYSKELLNQKIDLLRNINISNSEKYSAIYNSIESFFLTENGSKLVEEYVKNNSKNLDKIINIELEHELNEQLKEKEDRLKSLTEKLEETRKNLANQKTLSLADDSSNIPSNILEQLEEYKEKAKLVEDAKLLEWENGRLVKDIKNLRDDQKEIQKEIAQLEATKETQAQEINYLISNAKIKALEFKIFWDEFSKKSVRIESEKPSLCYEIKTEITQYLDNLLEAQDIAINALHKNITSSNYHVSKVMLANLLLCIQQNFITFLAGPPGVGKTSLVKKVCEKQNIPARLLNVPVGRGWTNQRDLIGFYNSLSDTFQPSNTGVFNFLSSLSDEFKENQPTAYILLDEANLSPIEHYWSNFMGQSDDVVKSVDLSYKILEIPKNLRFIATINNDETTEKLSPRILNRAAIIHINTNMENDNLISDFNLEDLYPMGYSELETLFGRSSTPLLTKQEEEIFRKVINILEVKKQEYGKSIMVSYRKQEAIKQYCHKGRSLLEMYTDNPLTALDLAIKQHVLPLISGYGYGLQKRLIDLAALFDQLNLEYSSNHLIEMINYGNSEMNCYDFFNI